MGKIDIHPVIVGKSENNPHIKNRIYKEVFAHKQLQKIGLM